MPGSPVAVETLIALAIRHVNAGQGARARQLCEHAVCHFAPHPAVLQLLAFLSLANSDAAQALRHAEASLALRPDHPPTIAIAVDAGFAHALALHDARESAAAVSVLNAVLRRRPGHVEALVNLGIVLQDAGRIDEAMHAYGQAFDLRKETFGRIAHALAAASTGRMWLDLAALREALGAAARRFADDAPPGGACGPDRLSVGDAS